MFHSLLQKTLLVAVSFVSCDDLQEANLSTVCRVLACPWKSLIFLWFSRPGKSLKTDKVIESPRLCTKKVIENAGIWFCNISYLNTWSLVLDNRTLRAIVDCTLNLCRRACKMLLWVSTVLLEYRKCGLWKSLISSWILGKNHACEWVIKQRRPSPNSHPNPFLPSPDTFNTGSGQRYNRQYFEIKGAHAWVLEHSGHKNQHLYEPGFFDYKL